MLIVNNAGQSQLPLLSPLSSQTMPINGFRCNCYKLIIAIILVFLLMQYAANFVAYRHKFTNISQSVSSINTLNNWISSPSLGSSENHNNVLNHVIRDTQSSSSSSSSSSFPSSHVSKNNDIYVNKNNGKHLLRVNSASNDVNSSVNVSLNVKLYSKSNSSLELCPLIPPKLVGRVKVLTDSPPMEKLESMFTELEPGGRFRPKECVARHKVAIIIPYRDREDHLRVFLHNIHPILQRQQLDYGIYIVEEYGSGKFNRAKLMNIGFVEALKQFDYQCFIFHDVDLLPEDDRNLYTCPEQPRHMSVAVDKFNYRLPYKDLFGGVSALTKEQFEKINGFSNEFWGWGGEDDDMSNRIRFYGYKISRYPSNIARYKMLKHKGDEPNPDRYKKLYSGKRRYKTDGINSIKYRRVDLVFKKLYTWVLVDVMGS